MVFASTIQRTPSVSPVPVGVTNLVTLVLALILSLSTTSLSFAQSSAPPISDIEIRGNQRIEAQTIRTYMTVVPGDSIDGSAINDTLKRLFDTGLFADVNIAIEGRSLVVNVVENPIINRVAFEGNRTTDDEELQTEIDLRPRIVYTKSRVQEATRRLIQLYQRNGRWGVVIEPKIIRLEQNRVDVVFEIDEGDVTAIRKISFIGNKRYSDSDLNSIVASREERWWRFLSSTDRYDPDRLAFDRELLRRHYLDNGYVDFLVKSATAELTPDRRDFFLTFNVEEGERFRYGTIDIETSIESLDLSQIEQNLEIESGAIYRSSELDDDVLALTFEAGRLGYAFVDINPSLDIDRENNVVNVTYIIDEGPRVYVERINIEGNVRTLDKVIRREFRLIEGDAFNTAKLQRSQQRVRGLGFFSDVQFETEEGSAEDRSIITVRVEEQSTGEISLGAGYSTDGGASGSAGIRERNLLGRGQDLALSFSVSEEDQLINLSFTEPYFLDRDLRAGFDVYRINNDFTDTSGYEQNVTGVRLRMGFPYNETLRQSLRLTVQQEEITNVDANASRSVREAEGTDEVLQVGQTLTFDERDSRINPTEGLFLSLNTELAGLLGDTQYISNTTTQEYHYEVFDDYILSARLSQGAIVGLGEDVAINNRFSLGGATLRGFESSGVGPRDTSNNDSLGGNYFYRGTTEFRFPLPIADDFGLGGRVFNDFGSLWGLDDESGPTIEDENSLRAAAGFGVTYASPFGPVTVDFGFPYLKEDYDETENFRFNFGTLF